MSATDPGAFERAYSRAWDRAQSLLKRRQAASSLGLGVNAALLTAMAFVMRDDTLAFRPRLLVIAILLSAGIIACLHWRRSLQAYQRLMSWWYGKLREMEKAFDDERLCLANAEYQALYSPQANPDLRVSLTTHEMRLIHLLLVLHIVFAALALTLSLLDF